MTTGAWFQGHLRELTTAECLELLDTKSVGRIAYDGPDGPEVLPLNFVIAEGSVRFRTSPHSALGRQLDLEVAAFEVDEVDDFTQSGWSVLLRGPVHPVESTDSASADFTLIPWPSGQRSLLLELRPRVITGRRLLPG
jgi:uncharacterized protein